MIPSLALVLTLFVLLPPPGRIKRQCGASSPAGSKPQHFGKSLTCHVPQVLYPENAPGLHALHGESAFITKKCGNMKQRSQNLSTDSEYNSICHVTFTPLH